MRKFIEIDTKISTVPTLTQLDERLKNLATMDQLAAAKKEMMDEFDKTVKEISAKYDALVKDNIALKARVDSLEAQLKTISKLPDPAFKRINFIGFPLTSAIERMKVVTGYLKE